MSRNLEPMGVDGAAGNVGAVHGVILRDDEMPVPQQNPQHAFDGIQEQEDELTVLQQYVDTEQWEATLLRLASHPHEVHHPKAQPGSKSSGMTALHLCLESASCPLALIQAILTRKPLTAAMRDRHGNTPLHIACAGEHAYNPFVIGTLLAAYPQAALIQEDVDGATPLHLLLTLCGGEADEACLAMLLDVAYSRVAGLPPSFVPLVDLICSPVSEESLEICANYPPIIPQLVKQMMIQNPLEFAKCLDTFLLLPAATHDSLMTIRPQLLHKDQPKLLLIQTKKGQTPLHTTCAKGSSLPVLKHIIDNERYPGAHDAARILEWKSRYPLWYAGCYQMPLDAIKKVFDLYPEAIRHIESYRMLHPHISYVAPGIHGVRDARKLELVGQRDDPSADPRGFFKVEMGYKIYQVTEFMTRLTYHESYEDPPPRCTRWRMVHAVAAIPSPPQLIRCAVNLNKWQLRERDEDLNLPVHLACKNRYREGNDEIHYWCLNGINRDRIHHFLEPETKERDNPITILTEAYPKGASHLDASSCLPLHLAVSTGKQWDEGVASLVQAAPQALNTRCGRFNLYPFLIAATSDCNTLDTLFRLMLQTPTLVQHGLRRTETKTSPMAGMATTIIARMPLTPPSRRPSMQSSGYRSGRNTPDSVGSLSSIGVKRWREEELDEDDDDNSRMRL
mmetsp:Transcript_43575/g.64673  ORF Transcript_43575/g.64673 Transcript_43575/m.64673 type:complete len:677 (-) Transcript_43575:85-2115(-)